MKSLILCIFTLSFRSQVTFASDAESNLDLSAFEKKTYEWNGFGELGLERYWPNRDSAIYHLTPHGEEEVVNRGIGALEIWGRYDKNPVSVEFRDHAEVNSDAIGTFVTNSVYEGFLSFKPSPAFAMNAGKRVLKWGKGYAWNPVAFVDRPKDPNDPELSREGFLFVDADLIKSFDGPLQTIAFTPVILPVYDWGNTDYGSVNYLNFAAKLYLLYKDTDIDIVGLTSGSRSGRFGFDFAKNLSENLEVHGEWAHITDATYITTDTSGNSSSNNKSADTYLIGTRYLTSNELTIISEYYHNGMGNEQSQLRNFYGLVESANQQFISTGQSTLMNKARQIGRSGYLLPNSGKNYGFLSLSQKEPFGILYFTPSISMIINLDDHSFTLTTEILYTLLTNLELRFRAYWLSGERLSEFGEKPNDFKSELRARYFF